MTDVEFKVVRSGVRPHRVAILVPLTSGPTEWLQVIEVCSQMWGGSYSVLVPTDGDSVAHSFWQLLDIYDPDIVVRWADVTVGEQLTRDIPKRINPFPPITASGELYQYYPIWPDNIPYPLTKITEVLTANSVEGCSSPIVSATPTVELLAFAHLGRLTSQTFEEIKTLGIAAGHPDFDLNRNPQRAGDLWNLAWEHRGARELDEWGKLPRDLSRVHLGLYSDPATPWHLAPVVLVIGDTAADFCLFYSLFHMRPRVYWLPPSLAASVTSTGSFPMHDLSANAVFQLAHEIDRSRLEANRDGRPFFVTSASCTADQIQDSLNRLEKARLVKRGNERLNETYTIENNVRELLRFRYIAWELNNSLGTVPHSVPVISGQGIGYLDVRPKHVNWNFKRQPMWVSEIAVDRYHLPRRGVFNSAALSFEGLAPDTRITSTGVAFNGIKQMVWAGTDLDVALARPKLMIMNPHTVLGLLANGAGYDIEVSEKGSYQDGTVRKLGGIDEFVQEFYSARWKVLSKYLDPSANQAGIYNQGMKIRERRYLDATSIAKLLGCGPDDPAVGGTIDHYLKRNVLQRGFALKCTTCRQMDWYEIADVDEQFRCSRCGVQQHLAPEVRWVYRLDELVFQFLQNNLADHVLSLAAISRSSKKGSFMSIPSFNAFAKEDRTKPYAEIDIACTIDGQVVIGECKSSGSLSAADKKQLKKYEVFAKNIGADAIVVSTSADNWNSSATAHFDSWRSQLTQFGIELRIFAPADLKPVP